MLIDDPLFYLISIPAVILYGIGKGGLGGALGDIVVPMMALTISTSLAAAILLPILMVMDASAIRYHFHNASWPHLRKMLVGGIAGVFMAALLLSSLSSAGLQLLVGAISIVFVLLYVFKKEQSKPGGTVSAFLWSSVGGFSSTAIHAGGGPVSIYLLPQTLDKKKLIGTIVWFFAILNYFKLTAYVSLGLINMQNIMSSLVLVPFALLGVKLGVMLLDKINQEVLYKTCYFFLFFSGLKLIYNGLF
ncbi:MULTISPECIES: sulfite exporter TauE/SafE family protein [Photobacterium]|uniref:Probable membrane transporter protein n=1 Tax=Photobacterium ganghwense TaxID=320778 RepID=A0A0J1K1C1_9GAMM|nr:MULTISPECIES: sulfite exporter TauE/SafE family protein [Photobacterium]KLV08237.1 membrane protein [Photobacterium ganghwense]MBV1839283.1 sulfite exporter TauE/SafE family protein [Photobacterium ganghwense]PSU07367.1 sulfite exporter TauE/SafE family protein [Photobacterium ganghwense]QSV16104.1 sulfite exporter TauE/SafE family protein [Photobacterium ganghwense]